MKAFQKLLPAALAGAIGGMFILGLGGRAVMAVIAIGINADVNLSFRGIFEVLLVGFLVGAPGGLLLIPARNIFPTSRLSRGIAIGTLLFLVSLLISWVTGGLKFETYSVLPVTLTAVAFIFLLYGVVIDMLLTRFEAKKCETRIQRNS